jgi:hypothetical protein
MIIISKTRLTKRQRSRIVRALRHMPTGYRIWDANIYTMDEAVSYRLPYRAYFTRGENAVLEHPIQTDNLRFDWLTRFNVIKYDTDKSRDWGNEVICPHLARQSIRSAVYYLCLTDATFGFEDFDVDVSAGHSITIPADMLYKIPATGQKRFLLYRHFMVLRSHHR